MNIFYMTTTEFAALIVSSLDEQNFFKKDIEYHPEDIYSGFVTIGDTIGKTMEWAINKEKQIKNKEALMRTSNLSKNLNSDSGFVTYTSYTEFDAEHEDLEDDSQGNKTENS